MSRMNDEDVKALLRVREGLINGHVTLLDGAQAPDVAMVRQKDVAAVLAVAIRGLEEILATGGGIEFGAKN